MDRKKSDKFNGSGYYDPTAYYAIKHSDEREKVAKRLVRVFQSIAHLVGFDIDGRIALRDRETGHIYK